MRQNSKKVNQSCFPCDQAVMQATFLVAACRQNQRSPVAPDRAPSGMLAIAPRIPEASGSTCDPELAIYSSGIVGQANGFQTAS